MNKFNVSLKGCVLVLMTLFGITFLSCKSSQKTVYVPQEASALLHEEVQTFAQSLDKNMRLCDEGNIDLTTFDQNLKQDLQSFYDRTAAQRAALQQYLAGKHYTTAEEMQESIAKLKTKDELRAYAKANFSPAFCVYFDDLLSQREIKLSVNEIMDKKDFSDVEKLQLLQAKYLLYVVNKKIK